MNRRAANLRLVPVPAALIPAGGPRHGQQAIAGPCPRRHMVAGQAHGAVHQHVAQPKLDRVHTQRPRHLVHLQLVAHRDLCRPKAAHGHARRVISIHRVPVHFDRRIVIRPAGKRDGIGKHDHAGTFVCPCVADQLGFEGYQTPVPGATGLVTHVKGVPLAVSAD